MCVCVCVCVRARARAYVYIYIYILSKVLIIDTAVGGMPDLRLYYAGLKLISIIFNHDSDWTYCSKE